MRDEQGWRPFRRAILRAIGAALGVAGGSQPGTGQAASDGDERGGDRGRSRRVRDVWHGPAAARTDLEPRPDRKYESVDTGVDYFGDGEKWDRRGPSGPERLTQVQGITQPTDQTLGAVRDALEREQFVWLEPGTVYRGDTQIVVDPVDSNGKGVNRILWAWGAGIDYTGDEPAAVEVLPNDDHDYAGRVKLWGGHYSGPGRYDGTDAAIRATDVFGAELEPESVGDATHGVLVRNVDSWSEATSTVIRNGERPPRLSVSPPTYLVRYQGASSTGGSGTNSFRASDVEIRWGDAADGGIIFWQDNASMESGGVVVRGFCPPGGSVYRTDGFALNTRAYVEGEGGDADSVGVVLNSDNCPTFYNPRVDLGEGTAYRKEGTGNALVVSTDGFEEITADGIEPLLTFPFDEATVRTPTAIWRTLDGRSGQVLGAERNEAALWSLDVAARATLQATLADADGRFGVWNDATDDWGEVHVGSVDLHGGTLRNLRRYPDDGDAPDGALYVNDETNQVEYKDASGDVHRLG